MILAAKNWDNYVAHAEEVARSSGFQRLRDHILEMAEPSPGDVAVDIGAGTGLLTLPLATLVESVWAVDVAASMTTYLRIKASSAGLENIEAVTASAISLPLVDESVDLVVSNYCFHHLDEAGKRRALAEIRRVLRPGGRLAFGDMMFRVSVADSRDRRVIAKKIRGLLHKGPAGAWRLARNGARFASGRWETPARAEWWRNALREAGFDGIRVDPLEHEGGLAYARRPMRNSAAAAQAPSSVGRGPAG